MNILLKKSDTLGAMASALCIVHCVATPFLLLVPTWWGKLDFVFLALSAWAVYQSARTTSLNFIKPAMWLAWTALFCLVLNEKLGGLHLPEIVTYLVAFSLVGLHLYNQRYCRCLEESCCMDKKQLK